LAQPLKIRTIRKIEARLLAERLSARKAGCDIRGLLIQINAGTPGQRFSQK
jgi:hypothetical protein